MANGQAEIESKEIQSQYILDEHLGNKVMSLCKKRGFLWPSFEIYGSIAGFYDYGPLGTQLLNNIKEVWRRYYLVQEGFVEIDSPIVTPEEVFKASGHVDEFTDLMTECEKCGEAYKAVNLLEGDLLKNVDQSDPEAIDALLTEYNVTCPSCKGNLLPSYPINLMFETSIGPICWPHRIE